MLQQMRRAAGEWHGAEVAAALSLRCIELHTYQAGGGLLDIDHRDTGSAVSMSILLSEAVDMEGGRFVMDWKPAAFAAPLQAARARPPRPLASRVQHALRRACTRWREATPCSSTRRRRTM